MRAGACCSRKREQSQGLMKNLMKLTTTVVMLGLAFAPRVIAQSGCTAGASSANHHDGTFVGNPSPECVEGISGTALEFDGTQNFVSVPNDAALYPQTSFTLETWFRTTGPGGVILGNSSSTEGYVMGVNSDLRFPVFNAKFQGQPIFATAASGNVTEKRRSELT